MVRVIFSGGPALYFWRQIYTKTAWARNGFKHFEISISTGNYSKKGYSTFIGVVNDFEMNQNNMHARP